MAGILRTRILTAAALLLLSAPAVSQVAAQETPMVAITRDDGLTFVYHTGLFPLGYGFHFERERPGEPAERLTVEPVYPPGDGASFLNAVPSEVYTAIRQGLVPEDQEGEEADSMARALDPFDVLTLSRADPMLSGFATYLYPSAARAYGRLFVDSTAVAGEQLTYRFIEVDITGDPTGEVYALETTIRPQRPAPPSDLAVVGVDTLLDMTWQYAVPEPGAEDATLYFDLYKVPGDAVEGVPALADGATGQLADPTAIPAGSLKLNSRPIIRNSAVGETRYFTFVPPGENPVYLVAYAVDMTGQRTAGEVYVHYIPDSTPPLPVEGVAVQVEDRTASVTWLPAPEVDLAGYHVYRTTGLDSTYTPGRLTAEILADPAFTDTTIPAEGARTYFYKVAAIDTAGNESMLTAGFIAQIEDNSPPPAPVDLVAEFEPSETGDGGTVLLSWNDEAAAPDLQTWIINRREIGVRSPIRTNSDDWLPTSYVDLGPTNGFPEGTRQEYTISGMDSTRNIGPGTTLVVEIPDLTPPAVPVGLAATPEDEGHVSLFWQPVLDQDLAWYALYRSEGGGEAVLVDTLLGDRQRFDDVDVERGVVYRYTLTAIDEAGNESAPSESSEAELMDYEGPPAVRNVRAVVSEGGVLVTWEPSPVPDVAGYRVLRAPIANGVFQAVGTEAVSEPRFRDANGEAGWYYRVVAVDESGNEGRVSPSAQVVR